MILVRKGRRRGVVYPDEERWFRRKGSMMIERRSINGRTGGGD
jgi:hypothetical protein